MKDETNNLNKLREPFPPTAINKLPRRFKDRNGNWSTIELDYVGHAELTERLLDTDPLWSWEPCDWDNGHPRFDTDKAGNRVGLWIKLTVCGRSMLGYGSCEPGKQDAVKELIGDALRNAAMRMGCALDLWKKTGPAQARMNAEAAPQPNTLMHKLYPPAQASKQAAAPKAKPSPDNEDPELLETTDLMTAVQDMFDQSAPSDNTVEGVPINFDGDETALLATTFSFGKHKGRTIGDLVKDKEGKSYLDWMKNKTVQEYFAGQKPSKLNHACLVAWKLYVAGPSEA